MAKLSDVIILAKLDSIEKKVNAIWLELQKMQDAATAEVIPELETQVNRASLLAGAIDKKVPDSRTSTQKKGQQNLWQ